MGGVLCVVRIAVSSEGSYENARLGLTLQGWKRNKEKQKKKKKKKTHSRSLEMCFKSTRPNTILASVTPPPPSSLLTKQKQKLRKRKRKKEHKEYCCEHKRRRKKKKTTVFFFYATLIPLTSTELPVSGSKRGVGCERRCVGALCERHISDPPPVCPGKVFFFLLLFRCLQGEREKRGVSP